MEEEQEIKPNPEVELNEYRIISTYLESNDNEEKFKDIVLPTPESLEKLCSQKFEKNYVNFDIKKYKAILEQEKLEKKESEEKEEKEEKELRIIINLDKISSIKNGDLLSYLLILMGGINKTNSIYDFFDESVKNPSEKTYIDNSPNYTEYIYSVIEYLKQSGKMSLSLSQLNILLEMLDEIGITIAKEDKNPLFRSLKDSILSLDCNKILVILAPSNNFWIKSPKAAINDQNYDIKLNNYNNIFYNKKFIPKFLEKIISHPRCVFGLLSSMKYFNLKKCWEGLEKQFSKICPKNIYYFDQACHEEISEKPEDKKKSYFRSLNKIIENLKNNKNPTMNNKHNKEKEENSEIKIDKIFNEKNILIVESEEDKMTDTKHNSIIVNLFNEQYLERDEKEKEAIDLEGDKVINYIHKLLETCSDDIRDYISHNKITDEYSKV